MRDDFGTYVHKPISGVGKCIYCGSTQYDAKNPDQRLGNEHIIPRGLGGRLELPLASCRKHEIITSQFETKCIGAMLASSRGDLGIVGRRARARRRTDRTPVTQPTIVPFIKFDPPGIIAGRSHDEEEGWANLWFAKASKDFNERFAKSGREFQVRFAHGFHAEEYARLLAKIAHVYCVASVGLEAFQPLLLRAIEGSRPMRLPYLVGTEWRISPKSACRHSISHDWRRTLQGIEVLIVTVRLFGHLGAPNHFIVAGVRPGTDFALGNGEGASKRAH